MEIPDGLQLTAFDPEFYADPYPVYGRLRSGDPVHKDITSFYEGSWTIADYETVSSLLRDERLSVDARSIGIRSDPRADNPVTLREPDMMNLDGEDHRRLRSLVQKAFTPSSVNQFATRIATIVERCLDTIQKHPFDVVTTCSKPIPTIVIAEYIGVDSADHVQFKQWTDASTLRGYPMPTDAQWDEIVAADQALRAYMTRVIELRRRQPRDDLVTRLTLAQHEDDRFSDREIVDMCALLIGAGNFTTTDLISNSIYQTISNGLTQADFDTLVDECLRYDTPVLAVRRFVTQEIAIGETVIPKGSVVNLLLGSANHDADQFKDAERFQPQRNPNAHLGFGRGPHHCLGAALAKLEVSITLQKFFERFPDAKVVSSRRSKRMDFRGFSSLVVSA